MGCDGTLGWDGVVGGREIQERTYVYLELIHVDVWQKPTQYCEAIILQSKQKKACMQMFIDCKVLTIPMKWYNVIGSRAGAATNVYCKL